MKKFLLFCLTPIATLLAQNLQISGGNNFSAAVCDNQKVNVWGSNDKGQLATASAAAFEFSPKKVDVGNTSNTTTPVTNGTLPPIRFIDAGSGAHLLGMDCNKQVWAWGENTQGQLGRNSAGAGSSPANNIPSRVLRGAQPAYVHSGPSTNPDPNQLYLNNIIYVSGGNNSSFAVEEGTGYVLAWGQNNYGQLGDGTTVNKTTPVYVIKEDGTRLDNIVSLEGGDACTYALDRNGNVWSWGQTNDGANDSRNIGRTPGVEIAAASPGRCAPRAERVVANNNPLNPGYSGCGTAFLSNIVQISGGDTHCLALDANGIVWSFGGDWGEGMLGRGGAGAVYQMCASRVVGPGITKTTGWVATDFLGAGVDGKAIYVAAGQASSGVVMANGKVVTFGARGLFVTGNAFPATGTVTCNTTNGEVVPSGTLGDGLTGATRCQGGCATRATAGTFSTVPVYVTGIPATEKAVQISDGDAWYYVITDAGNTYTWGWNRRGELGVGDYTDRCSAVLFPAPTGCIGGPCPLKPLLGTDKLLCPGPVSVPLTTNVPDGLEFEYIWEKNSAVPPAALTNTWTAVGTDNINYTATTTGYYRVTIHDKRTATAALCGPCPDMLDTIKIEQLVDPFTLGCNGRDQNNPSLSWAEINSTQVCPNNKYYWFDQAVGDSAFSDLSLPKNDTIILARTTASNLYVLETCGSTDLRASTPAGCNNTGSSNQPIEMMIEVKDDVIFSEFSFVITSGTNTCTGINLTISDNTGIINCGNCPTTGGNSKYGPGTAIYNGPVKNYTQGTSDSVKVIPVGFQLKGTPTAPGYYWLRLNVSNSCNYRVFGGCATNPVETGNAFPRWANPDNSTDNSVSAVASVSNNNSYTTDKGYLRNLKFDKVSDYDSVCGRKQFAISSAPVACILPVDYVSFTLHTIEQGVDINWITSYEAGIKYFSVQRSINGRDFIEITKVFTSGEKNTLATYSAIDKLEGVESALIYYRVVSITNKGLEDSFTKVRSVNIYKSTSSVSIAPNPNTGSFKVSLEDEVENISVEVLDLAGRLIYTQSGSGNVLNVNLGATAKGVYLVYVSNGADKWVEKVVIE